MDGGGLSEDALALQAPDLSGGELSAVQDIIGPHTNHIILNDYAGEYAGCGAQLSPVGQEMFENLWLNPTTWGIRGGVGWLDFAPATRPPLLPTICTISPPLPAILQRKPCFGLGGGA
jgi:hypothetical protein